MKKKYLMGLLLTMFIIPFKVLAVGGFNVSNTNITMYPGETKTITINTSNAVGKLNVLSSNNNVASISLDSIFIQSPGASEVITITSKSVGTATISVVASSNFATMDEEILTGVTKTITVKVVEKQTTNSSNNNNNNDKPQNNLSNNNKIKSIEVEDYELVKVDDNNYILEVNNGVISVNVKAMVEDSKAKVTGVGTKELKVGENNIVVIVTSESGIQNKINIKVTRKDGYYLDDIELLLENDKIQDVDITINEDSKITKELLNKINESNKIVRLNYYNEDKKIIYSWILDGNDMSNCMDIITNISFITENENEINKLSNYSDGMYVNFKQNNDIPTGIKIKLFVGDKYENGSLVNLYQYNNNSLNIVNKDLEVTDGYVVLELDNVSEYFITMAVIDDVLVEEESSFNIFKIFTVIELLIIVILVVFMILKFRKKKNNDKIFLNVNN